MPDVRLGVLGPLVVRRDGERCDVPPGRQRVVLTALIVHAGQPVSADWLIDAAWADAAPEHPRAALYTVVSRLRALLGGETVRSVPEGYLFDVPDECIDAVRFERLCSLADDQSTLAAADALDEALALWRGEAYAGCDDEIVLAEARRLNDLRLAAIERRERIRIDGDGCAEAAARLAIVVEANPYREHALELLMTALYRCGRATEALDRYRAYRTTLADELGLDPSPGLRDLEARILGHDLPVRSRRDFDAPPWLDTSTAFVGRDDDVDKLCEAVRGARLVTVTGPGGVGKSRLVAQALPDLCVQVAAPAVIVELASVRPGAVQSAIAERLGLMHTSGTLRAALLDYLAISDLLLVVDSCEHVLDEMAAFADQVTRRCRRVRVVATGRHRLGLPSERVLSLSSLPVSGVDDDPARIRESPALRLLDDRVRRIRPDLVPGDDDARVAADICRRLDGLPLALELAAAQAAVLGQRAVLQRLRENPTALDGSGAVRATVDSSVRLLTPAQRTLFLALSVVPGGFGIDAIEGLVAELPDWSKDATVSRTLGELVDYSLLTVRRSDGTVLYRMLSIVQAVAVDMLAESGTERSVRRAHALWVRSLANDVARDSIGPNGSGAFARLDRNRGSVAAALRWAIGCGDLGLAGDIAGAIKLCPHWSLDVGLSDLIVLVGERCASTPSDRRSLAIGAGAMALVDRGDVDRGRSLASLAYDMAKAPYETYLALLAQGVGNLYAGDQEASARCWHAVEEIDSLPLAYQAEAAMSLALIDGQRNQVEGARRQAEHAIDLAERSGSPAMEAFALYVYGEAVLPNDHLEGLEILTAAAERAEEAGAAHVRQVARLAMLSALVRLGRRREALDVAPAIIEDERRSGAWPQLWTTMRILAELFDDDGAEDAAFLLSAANHAAGAPPIAAVDAHRYAQLNERLAARLGATVTSRIAVLARGLPRVQVIDRASEMLRRRTA